MSVSLWTQFRINRILLFLIVVMALAAGCQPLPSSTAPATAAPASAAMPTVAPSPAATVVVPATVATSTASVATTPTLAAMPGPDVKPAMDTNFRDPAEPWCQGGSYDFGDFFCQDGEYHLINKGYANLATNYGGSFRNFVLQAEMRLSGENEPYLGVDFEMLTPDIAASEGITGTQGALLGSVVAGGPAAAAGLNQGDAITAVNGKPVDDNNDLVSRVAVYKANDEVHLTVVKGTANGPTTQRDVQVKVGQRPADQPFGAYGVVFRGNGDQRSFYIFMVHPSGEFQLITWSPGAIRVLIPWTDSAAIKQGQATNLLQVIAQGTRLTLLANGQQVASVSDDAYTEGVAGPVALEDGHAIVSSFKVWELP